MIKHIVLAAGSYKGLHILGALFTHCTRLPEQAFRPLLHGAWNARSQQHRSHLACHQGEIPQIDVH